MVVVQVGEMPMDMPQRLVPVWMAVGFAGRVHRVVRMLMVLIVPVEMFVRHFIMDMFVAMAFREMKKDSRRHQAPGYRQPPSEGFAAHSQGDHGAHEGRQREVRARTRGPDVAERKHKAKQAEPVAQEPDEAAGQVLGAGYLPGGPFQGPERYSWCLRQGL